ncbi:uncharacterized protein BX664DRAFT_352762 [Halteromyces radiatus]|uniref:uncharacterized protein n=1 Tax=Halteromyces radiatus TaxID=101107 RepID=UPI00221E489A|nr:uncharacterized protein BX664DRAFT_352762 [Halteromyces radiatus]KAI8081636.1 hypothetical protein BX664DRAFT_352762 [Halteromyces radiatus]
MSSNKRPRNSNHSTENATTPIEVVSNGNLVSHSSKRIRFDDSLSFGETHRPRSPQTPITESRDPIVKTEDIEQKQQGPNRLQDHVETYLKHPIQDSSAEITTINYNTDTIKHELSPPQTAATTDLKEDTTIKSENKLEMPSIDVEQRRLAHKEVERRRRETITHYINQLAEIVNTTRRQKGEILRDAIDYIKTLKEEHNAAVQKWTLEKILTEQTIRQLQDEMEDYKRQYEELRDINKAMCIERGNP